MKHPQAPIKRFYERTSCFCCGREIDANKPKRWFFTGVTNKRHYAEINLAQSCESCSDMDLCVSEAEHENRRFTVIGCGTDAFDVHGGDRCACGAVTHTKLGFCIQCWKAHRLLDRAQAEARLVSQALKELRKQIKTNKEAAIA